MTRRCGIKVKNHVGTWYALSERQTPIGRLYLVESELYGDEAPCLWIDSTCRLILEDVWNGAEDLEEYFESRGIK